MFFWGTIALVSLIAWKLSHRHKVITLIAALSCFALLYVAGYQTSSTATSSTPATVRQ
jgi:hypothetical protein